MHTLTIKINDTTRDDGKGMLSVELAASQERFAKQSEIIVRKALEGAITKLMKDLYNSDCGGKLNIVRHRGEEKDIECYRKE